MQFFIKKNMKNFSAVYIIPFFVIKTLDPDWIRIRNTAKNKLVRAYSVMHLNADPDHGFIKKSDQNLSLFGTQSSGDLRFFK
jgi:hypothetical protein